MAIVVPANEEGRKFYEQAEVKPAKWLLPDGSITDKFPMAGGGSDVKLQNNKEVSITQNGEIEITPDSGYDGMKKVTANVNVSGGGGATAYAWAMSGAGIIAYTNFDIAPSSQSEYNNALILSIITQDDHIEIESMSGVYTRISDTEFSVADYDTFTREPTKDFTLWEPSE